MHVRGEGIEAVLFLCDRKACEGGCLSENCTHTTDIRHAANFDTIRIDERRVDYFEIEPPKKELVGHSVERTDHGN